MRKFLTNSLRLPRAQSITIYLVRLAVILMTTIAISCSKGSEPSPKETESIKDEAESIYVADYKSTGYMAYAGKLYSIDAKTGSRKWEFPIDYQPKGAPEIDNGLVFLCGKHVLQAIDAKTGAKKWERKTSSEFEYFNFVTVVNKVAFLVDRYKISALDAATGAEKWSFSNFFIETPPVVADGVIFFGSYDTKFYAVDAITGKQKWSIPLYFDPNSMPSCADATVFVPLANEKFTALNAINGELKWTLDSGEKPSTTPTMVSGIVYIGASASGFKNYLYALDAVSGKEKWKSEIGRSQIGSPFVANDAIYGGYWDLMAFDIATGKKKWEFDPDGNVSSYNAPVAVNNLVYASCNNSNVSLYAINATTGKKMWTFKADNKDYMTSPSIITKLGKVIHPATSGVQQ
jgi:outer membrane protein assembly factor BamB